MYKHTHRPRGPSRHIIIWLTYFQALIGDEITWCEHIAAGLRRASKYFDTSKSERHLTSDSEVFGLHIKVSLDGYGSGLVIADYRQSGRRELRELPYDAKKKKHTKAHFTSKQQPIRVSTVISSIQSQDPPTANRLFGPDRGLQSFLLGCIKTSDSRSAHLSFTFSFSMLTCSPAAILASIASSSTITTQVKPRHHQRHEHYRQREFLTWLTINVPPVSQTDRQCRKRWVLICNLSTNYLWHMPAAVDTSVLSIDTCTVQQPNSSKYLPSHIPLSLLLKDRPISQWTSSSHDEYPGQTSYVHCPPLHMLGVSRWLQSSDDQTRPRIPCACR